MPIGMPGWPEFACWTASIARMRNALAISPSRTRFCPRPALEGASFISSSGSVGPALALDELQDQRGEDELHREVELVARHDDRIGPRHEGVVDHRQQVREIDAARV